MHRVAMHRVAMLGIKKYSLKYAPGSSVMKEPPISELEAQSVARPQSGARPWLKQI